MEDENVLRMFFCDAGQNWKKVTGSRLLHHVAYATGTMRQLDVLLG